MANTVKLQIRRDTAATWTSVNPSMLIGEIGFEIDTRKIKIGTSNNVNWSSLDYIVADPTAHTHTESEITDLGSYAASSHSHGLSDLTATGTPSVSNFLRGDNTWSSVEQLSALGNVTGTVTVDISTSNIFTLTMTGNITLSLSNLPASPPKTIILRVEQGGTGSYTITWDSIFKHPNDTAPTLGTAVGDAEWFLFEMVSGTRIEVFKADGPYKA